MTRLVLIDVQVIEIDEELVETMNGREEFVAVAQKVFAELAGHVAKRLEQLGDSGVFFLEPLDADLGIAGAHRYLAGDKGSTPGREGRKDMNP